MPIKFACPNGHPLSTTEARAGKPGKCPKCGTGFVVPTLEEYALAGEGRVEEPLAAGASDERAAALHDSGPVVVVNTGEKRAEAGAVLSPPKISVGPASTRAAPAAAPEADAASRSDIGPALPPGHIVFLCPNGHKLNGPKKLEGKPGQCPHCGARFRIPIYDENPETVSTPELIEPEEAGEGEPEEYPHVEEFPAEAPELDEEIIEFPQEAEILEYAPSDDTLGEAPGGFALPAEIAPANTLSYVVTRLWRERTGPVEVLLKSGEKILPQYFSPELSQHEFGVFGLANEDGTYQVLVLAWDDVARVGLHKLKELPKGLFE